MKKENNGNKRKEKKTYKISPLFLKTEKPKGLSILGILTA